MPEINFDDLKPFADLAQSFANRELAGNVVRHDRYPFGEFYEDVLRKIHEVGFLNAALPAELGGEGFGIAALCEILMHLSQADASPAGIIFTQSISQKILLAAGAQELAGNLLSGKESAKDALIAFPVYANPAFIDALPVVQRNGGEYMLTGRVELLVLGNLARQAVVAARAGRGPAYSFFLVDLDHRDIKLSDPVFTLGLHACPAVDLTMKNTKARRIGEENEGSFYFDKVLPEMIAAAAAINAGILRGSFFEAMAYARKREQGGRPIIRWSEVAMMLAGLSVKADVAQMCVHQCYLELEQERGGFESRVSAAALHIAELACEGVNDGIQILGGYGYMKDYGQEKRYRDARMVQAMLGAAPMKKITMIRRNEATESGNV